MPLLDRDGLRHDDWTRLEPESPFPDLGHVLTAPDRLADAPDRPGLRLGAELAPGQGVDSVLPFAQRLSLITLPLPSFADGRAFSLAGALRAAGYGGTLRAVGHVIVDQLAPLLACGVDEVEISQALLARQPEARWRAAAAGVGLRYQRGYRRLPIIPDLRAAAEPRDRATG